ncbi:MAG TPA: hypothetical protein VF173_24205 [Thermoanaerobaculia bacterium]|nr:hypothetical protein [Thermoanaerobaculia bacterium]
MPETVDIARLRAAVAGRDPVLARTDAMAELARRSDAPDRHLDLDAVLKNGAEDALLRARAAIHLAEVGTPEAMRALVAAAETAEGTVLSVVMRAVGPAAGASALPAVERAAARSQGAEARQARFAATLIAHRFDLPGHEVPMPAEGAFLPLPSQKISALRFTAADPAAARAAVADMGAHRAGVALSERSSLHLACGPLEWLLLLAEDAAHANGPARLAGHKAVAAVLASRGHESSRYKCALYVLTAPVRGGLNVFVFAGSGRLAYAGTAAGAGGTLRFSARAVADGAVAPVAIKGAYDGSHVAVSRAEIAFAPPARRPQPQRL